MIGSSGGGSMAAARLSSSAGVKTRGTRTWVALSRHGRRLLLSFAQFRQHHFDGCSAKVSVQYRYEKIRRSDDCEYRPFRTSHPTLRRFAQASAPVIGHL